MIVLVALVAVFPRVPNEASADASPSKCSSTIAAPVAATRNILVVLPDQTGAGFATGAVVPDGTAVAVCVVPAWVAGALTINASPVPITDKTLRRLLRTVRKRQI